MYFITGGTGFIGKYLVEELLKKHKGTIYILIRQDNQEYLDLMLEKRWLEDKKRIKSVTGDILQPNFGMSEAMLKEIKGNVKHFFHLAALYDLKANLETSREFNITGTKNAIEFANQLGVTFHYMSSIVVGGLHYKGFFHEDMLDKGQKLDAPYAVTKYEAEILVRQKVTCPLRVYRPGIVIGSSLTGEAEKIDGPYYSFRVIQAMGKYLPQWLPLLGIQGGQWYLVPVDFVASAMAYIAHQGDLDGKTFHLIGKPIGVGEMFNEFSRVAHAPQFKIQLPNQLLTNSGKVADKLPIFKLAKQQFLDRLELPEAFMDFLTWETKFDNTQTVKALRGSGIVCPPLRDYARVVWEFWESHMEPIFAQSRKPGIGHAIKNTGTVITRGRSLPQVIKDRWEIATDEGRDALAKLIEGKIILITGGSSGIGLAIAHRLARAHGTVILVARSLDKLEAAKLEVEQLGGKAYAYSCDLSSPDAVGEMTQQVLEDHGGVDILINNAGRSIRRPVHHAYDRFHDFQRTMDLNYFGCVKLILGVLPGMRSRNYGHVINISSIGCQTKVPRFSAYVASKSALDAFSRCIGSEVLHDHVVLTTVYMPLVRTPMIAPTKMYDNVPTLTPDQAAKLALRPLLTKSRKASTPLGTFAEVLHAVSPKTADVVLNLGYRLFPDSDPKDKEGQSLSAESVAFAYLSRGVHW